MYQAGIEAIDGEKGRQRTARMRAARTIGVSGAIAITTCIADFIAGAGL